MLHLDEAGELADDGEAEGETEGTDDDALAALGLALSEAASVASDEDRKLAEQMLAENPPSFVADEATWQRAKEAAGETAATDFWALVTHIYRQMGGAFA